MRCNDALALLQTVNEGADARAPSDSVRELISSGFLAPAPAAGAEAGLEQTRQRLSEIAASKESLLASLRDIEARYPGIPPSKVAGQDPEHGRSREHLEALEAEERTLRTRFLDQLHLSAGAGEGARVNGERFCVTYKGRELLGELFERRERVGAMEVGDFLSELEAVKRHFEEMAVRSHNILKRISPAFPDLEEIHFRMAAVGLAARLGDPGEASDLFIRAYRDISDALNWQDPVAVTLAENLVLRAQSGPELEGLLGRFRALIGQPVDPTIVREEQFRAMAIVLSSGGDVDDLYRQTWELARLYCPNRPSAGAFLAAVGAAGPKAPGGGPGAVLQSFSQLREWMVEWGIDVNAEPVAVAIMAIGPYPPADALERFGRAFTALSRYNGGGMEVPAAMIAILPLGVEESLDNVRLASAAIVQNQLSLGGAENLSLGIKLLVQSSIMAASSTADAAADNRRSTPLFVGAPPVLAMTGVVLAAAMSLEAGMATFHESSVHRAAWRDYQFHPVHHHYIYG